MNIASTNVIPPNIPSSRKSQPNFGMSRDEREMRGQKYELERYANDKSNPIAVPMKVLAVATGAVVTTMAMQATMKTSLELVSKVLKSDKMMKIRTSGAKLFNEIKESIKKGLKSLKETVAEKYEGSNLANSVTKQKEKFAKTKLGKFTSEKISPKYSNFKEALKTLRSDIKDISKEKIPTREKIKKIFIDATAILAGGGVAIKESSAINKSNSHDIDEEEY